MKEQTFKIPLDMTIDVFKIVVKENLKHEVAQVDESRGLLIVIVFPSKNSNRQIDAVENIKEMLLDYQEYRFSESDELDWRDV
jgi:hypothetical protein